MISKNALDLIYHFEGLDTAFNWPGGASGITIGIGFDLGYNLREQIQKDWQSYVNGNILSFMMSCSGVKGDSAKRLLNPVTRTLRITEQAAKSVFENSTLPRFKKLAFDTYPGLENLPEDAQGAIISLVFNRGASFGIKDQQSWETRREMRELAPLILSGDLQSIAEKIREMKRLWIGKGLDGLIARREAEAELINPKQQL